MWVKLRIQLMHCFLLLLLCALPLSAQASTPRLLVLGDSLSAAYQMPEEAGWVSLLQQQMEASGLDWQVVNASISGETTSGGLSRLPGLLRQHQPAMVLIELGGNDGLRGLPPSLIKNNLSRLIQLSLAEDAQVLLAAMRIPPNYGRAYVEQFEAIYPQLAEEYQVPLIPFILESIATQPSLMMADGIHPTEAAQPLIRDKVWLVLDAHLK